MTIKGTFPLFYNYCHSENHDFWKGNLITDSLNEFIGLVDKVLSESSFIGPDEFHSTAKLLIDDILASKLIATKQELEILNFLQFYYSEASASYLSQNGLFTQVHDWLVWSVSDQINYGVEVTFQLKRIGSFFESKISLIVNNRTQSYIHWMTTLFYYSRHQGGLKELSKLILDEEHFRLTSLPKNNGLDYDESEALHLLCQALAWSIDNQESKGYNFAELIKDWIPNLSSINQKSANLQLATGGAQFTKENSEFYAKQVIDKFSDLCKGHELLHAQCIYYAFNLDELDSNPDSLKHAFEIYGSSIGNISNISKKYEKGRIFGILRGLVMTCLKNAKAKLAFYLLSEFYEKGSDFNNHLFFALNIEKQICSFISENRFSNGHELSIDEYRNLIKISNKFLGTKISLQDDPHFILEEPKYLGLPDKDFGIQFEEALSSYYSLNCLNKSDINDFESLIVIPGHQHPVQALMVKELGYSVPINVSLEKPKTFKSIDKVLLWCYGTLSSDRELDMVSKLLKQSGVDVDAVNILEETKKSFLTKFKNPEYDIIWIATHGNYNHMLPHKSSLSILPNFEISIEELDINLSNFQQQRLLFLNVCDGATSATHNSLYEHGFGASLANSNQCVVSHLWPVETEPALLFGILFAHNLTKGNFWKSYEMTIRLLCQDGKRALKSLIEEYEELNLSEIEEKITIEIQQNIYYWGSSVFYN